MILVSYFIFLLILSGFSVDNSVTIIYNIGVESLFWPKGATHQIFKVNYHNLQLCIYFYS